MKKTYQVEVQFPRCRELLSGAATLPRDNDKRAVRPTVRDWIEDHLDCEWGVFYNHNTEIDYLTDNYSVIFRFYGDQDNAVKFKLAWS